MFEPKTTIAAGKHGLYNAIIKNVTEGILTNLNFSTKKC